MLQHNLKTQFDIFMINKCYVSLANLRFFWNSVLSNVAVTKFSIVEIDPTKRSNCWHPFPWMPFQENCMRISHLIKHYQSVNPHLVSYLTHFCKHKGKTNKYNTNFTCTFISYSEENASPPSKNTFSTDWTHVTYTTRPNPRKP